MKLCVFPNDPLRAYYEKGEIKERYFNPNNMFNEIHCISTTSLDIEEVKVQKLAGSAKFHIHSVGEINIKNYKKEVNRIIELVKVINPDVIRTFNPLVQGWLAAKCSEKLEIPFVLSLHTNYNSIKKNANFKKKIVYKYTEKFIEPYVLNSADKIIIVFDMIKYYVNRFTDTFPETLYNGIDLELFSPSTNQEKRESRIISVGNFTKFKDHKCLIRAMRNIDAKLILIGNGDKETELKDLIKKLDLEKKIEIKKSIPNNELPSFYRNADIFALAYYPEYESIPKPVMEAMGCGLPVVVTKSEKFPTGLENIALSVKRVPEEFSDKINKLLNDSNELERYSKISLKYAKKFDIHSIESRQSEIYHELLDKNTDRFQSQNGNL